MLGVAKVHGFILRSSNVYKNPQLLAICERFWTRVRFTRVHKPQKDSGTRS